MHRLLERLSRDHRNLEKILAILTTQLDLFFAGRESDFDLKIELMEYLEAFADTGHHPLENLIYGLAQRRIKGHDELFERLAKQHHDLARLTRTFRHSLEGIVHEAVMSRAELETQGREYVALQQLHLALEDREVFPLLDRELTEDDWSMISANMPRHDDPVFEAPDQVRFYNLVTYLRNE
ncbi:MAG: hemerythrin domain-containing protein [Gammaproteobacteria bacterium]|nr:hemerythrin domain-containing protein [Gammaproteobacteria bacterium]MCB1879068.1 hemerythrin domain-containing protein [Gammaproteobacteria bacterium]MCB1903401.1 hemerythrin domain-containing protein [Gammaproteobacteria bacterium]